jgi:hypothetical protein
MSNLSELTGAYADWFYESNVPIWDKEWKVGRAEGINRNSSFQLIKLDNIIFVGGKGQIYVLFKVKSMKEVERGLDR